MNIKELEKDYINNINLIEPIKEGILKVVYQDEHCLISCVENVYICYLVDEQGVPTILEHMKSAQDILCINGYDSKSFKQCGRWLEDYHDYNYAYLKKEMITISLPEGVTIRKLTQDDLDYVFDHYETVQDRVYLRERIDAGMYGVCEQGKLRGFIGMHDEGTVGILFVEDLCKRKHYGSALEATLINDLLDQNRVPFGQVDVHNVPSKRLQDSLGLIQSKTPVHWYF